MSDLPDPAASTLPDDAVDPDGPWFEGMRSTLRDLLQRRLSDERVIVAVGPVVAGATFAEKLLELGVERCLVIGESRGTGQIPTSDRIDLIDLDIVAPDIMAGIRAYERQLAHLDESVLDAIDRFDPEGRALALPAPFFSLTAIAGRRVFGRRPTSWVALEDKIVIDDFWDAAGVTRAPARIVPAERAALRAAATQVDQGLGTCWAGDAREGFNGGAIFVRWIEGDANIDEAVAFFGAHCDRVRVMPFLDGIPCSMHGMVFADAVIAVRPNEMMVFRRPGRSKLLYAGLNTFWDPTPADRAALRAIVHDTGRALRSRVDYRGGFTVDGVLTADGFRPTELNTRLGAGAGPASRACATVSLYLVDAVVREDGAEGLDPVDLERFIVGRADARRGGGGWTVVDAPVTESRTHGLCIDEDAIAITDVDGPNDGTLLVGPSTVGGFVRFTADPERTPKGPSLAPRVARVFRFADEQFDAGIGSIVPAPDLRGSSSG